MQKLHSSVDTQMKRTPVSRETGLTRVVLHLDLEDVDNDVGHFDLGVWDDLFGSEFALRHLPDVPLSDATQYRLKACKMYLTSLSTCTVLEVVDG